MFYPDFGIFGETRWAQGHEVCGEEKDGFSNGFTFVDTNGKNARSRENKLQNKHVAVK